MKGLNQPESKAEILARLEHLTPDSPRQFGTMTPHQAVVHLTDGFKVMTGVRPITLPPTSGLQSTIFRWIGLYLPVRWTPGIKAVAEMDQNQKGTPPTTFVADKAELKGWIENISSGMLNFKTHPLLGDMNPEEWQRWSYLHCDHHLRQFGV